jgi:Rieske Fe-S protein
MERSWCKQGHPADAGLWVGSGSPARRTVLKVILGLGVGLRWIDSVDAQGLDPRAARPREGDRFVSTAGGPSREALAMADVPSGGPPVTAYPMDPTTRVVRDGSRLNQVLLVHLDPSDLSVETRARAAEGIVAYSAICTHTGCDSWEWQAETRTLKCPCHFSTFDVRDGARVLDGPAPRRLPALPLKTIDGVLVAAGSFSSRPGFQQEGGSR